MESLRLLAVVPFVCLAACGASSDKSGEGGGNLDGAVNPDAGLTIDGGLDVRDPGDGGLVADASEDTGGPLPGKAAVYAHSASTLYKLDPETLKVTEIGPFADSKGGSIGDMTDIALDKDGVMFGVTFEAVYRIDYKAAPKCTKLATLSTMFNGLTMVPAGTIDPAKEVLVGVSNDGGWHRIDVPAGATSATVTRLGSYGSSLGSSGDSVGIIGDAVYSTVTGLGFSDHVITVDPKTGKMIKDVGDTGVTGLYGVGYWGGTMYGFASSGSLYSIDLKTGKATAIPLSGGPSDGWWGAGVTTAAPITIK
jgi:hypothetical protein